MDSETNWVTERQLESFCWGLYEGGYPSDRIGNEITTREEAEDMADDDDEYLYEVTVTRHKRTTPGDE